MNWLLHSLFAAILPVLTIAAFLTSCTPLHCTSTLQRGCDPMPKWEPVLEIIP